MEAEKKDLSQGVIIVGGGTAGYLAALTLRAFHPNLEITLIDSSAVPIIGVGEATTSEIVPFLHSILNLDPSEFYKKVVPTWKLGIKFFWGPQENSFFNYPFDRGPILESHLYEGHTHNATLNSALMVEDLSPLLSVNDTIISLLPKIPFAYHLDNVRFVQYLRDKAAERNIQSIDIEIVDAILSNDGESIDHLVTSDGLALKYDFYIDCSGFRSLLLEKKLNSPFKSYSSSLFTDSAVIANSPRSGAIKPYTTAETMDNGWCWNIPQIDEDHLGYVFASEFCTTEQAISEFLQKHSGIHEIRTLKFRSGRHEHFVKGNVAAIGNSYGFVEPLESTGIFVICRECILLSRNLEDRIFHPKTQNYLNTTVADIWDYLRWFLAVHYKYNKRISTPFWQECRSRVDVSGAASILASYENGAPLSYSGVECGPGGGHNFNEFGYDVLLFGQALPAHLVSARLNKNDYFDHVKTIKSLVSKAIKQEAALDILLHDGTEILGEMMEEQSWVTHLAKNMIQSCSEQTIVKNLHPTRAKLFQSTLYSSQKNYLSTSL